VSLTAARGPFAPDRAGWFSEPVPDDLAYIEPHPRRVVGMKGERPVVDTEDVLLIHRRGQTLKFAFRRAAVGDLPHDPVPEAPGYVTVPWDAVDSWFEEGRRLVFYPPNPYHRVDCRPTQRRLRVEAAGTTLVDTDDTVILFETGLAPRLYVSPNHVRTDLLRATDTRTYCNYKGWATYWAVEVRGTVIADVAWSYEEPLPESTAIKGHLSFDLAKVEVGAQLPSAPPRGG
jgi:uncharacterized protein (DUF427 family)